MNTYLAVFIAILGIAYAEGDYNGCQQNRKINNDTRNKFLEMHNGFRCIACLFSNYLFIRSEQNSYRSLFAQKNKASKMEKLIYDCDLENSAYNSQRACETDQSKPSTEEENLYFPEEETYIPEEDMDDRNFALEAVNSWSSEIFDLKENVYKFKNTSSIANIVWDSHNRVGCAVVDCSGKTHVVCHYGPKVKGDGKTIYEKGEKACSGCENGGTCDDEFDGLCPVKLSH
ncbi:SCP-like protein [Ancylostoma ceylanicum]|uniref:SCP-like protein n=2 Tax=Ancylostoma ceylanicum TaxID=53326 RepID=A0A0D6LPS3_9BILA|nr:SCP-like protein [Ancylostoma ceylanicum]EYC08215.1 hypothetical protein Y032_0067g52 [Ancylostoma ceylanicum]